MAHQSWSLASGRDDEWSGPWAGIDRKYLPLKIIVGSQSFLGWAQISVNKENGAHTLHQYYCRTNPDEGVEAGIK